LTILRSLVLRNALGTIGFSIETPFFWPLQVSSVSLKFY
jgi:hypothetical protein